MPRHPGRLAAPTLLLAAMLAAAAPVPVGHATAAPTLTDLAGHWAAGEIQAAVEAGWIGGYPDGSFQPDGNVTRAEFLSMLTRYLDTTHLVKPVTDERIAFFQDRFADGGHWSAVQGAVKGALAYQVLEPSDYPALFKGGELVGWSFAPDQPLTRMEAAVMLTRALGGKYAAEGYHFHPGEVAAPPISFADGPQMADWARGWVAQAASSGVIKGYPDGTFGGERPIIRAEAVAMVRRLESAPRQTLSLLEEVRTHSADQPRLEALPRLAEANRNLVAELDLHVAGEADQDRWAVEHAWFQADPANRKATLQMWAVDFYRKVKARELEPLRLKAVKVTFRTNDTNPIATATYDGTSFTYSEMQPFAPAKEYPALAADLLNRLTVMDDRSAEAIERSKQNLAQIEHDLAHVKARTVLTFPYQYLADWFRLPEHQVVGWARERAAAYFAQVRPSVEAVGGKLEKVELLVAPADTAGRLAPYQSLRIGDSLLANPVLSITFDGQVVDVTRRPFPLTAYTKALEPVYQQEMCGEGCSQPVVDPPVAEAQQILRNVIMTHGRTGR